PPPAWMPASSVQPRRKTMQGEYRGDFTRDTFDPLKHFSRVFMQQGRVQLDPDWNEQAAILHHFLRSLAAGLIGQHGGPAANSGFEIEEISGATKDFAIGGGHYYVDGILCELETTPTQIEVISVQPPSAPDQLRVSTLVVDEIEFRPGQWVEILDPITGDSLNPAVLSAIASVDRKANKLTLKSPLDPKLSGKTPLLRRVATY